eukprot:722951_1
MTGKHTQKIKLNGMNLSEHINVLIQSNKTLKNQNNKLIQERDHYKNGCNIYKKEANEWKSQYTQLYSQLCYLTNTTYSQQVDNIHNINTKNKMNSRRNIIKKKAKKYISNNSLLPINEAVDFGMIEIGNKKLKLPKLKLSNCMNDFEECMVNMKNNFNDGIHKEKKGG